MSSTSHSNENRGSVAPPEEEHREELEQPPAEQEVEAIPEEQLQAEAENRARRQPVVTRMVRALKRERKDFAELVINAEPLETRVALLRNGVLEKFEVERQGDDRMVGTIYKGRVQNLEPGLKAAFVDIEEPKNAFLHYWDMLPAANDSTVEIVRENRKEPAEGKEAPKITVKDIPTKYPVGTEIVVQVTKATIGSKGPRTTTNISLPGRFLVLMPFSGQCGISRKIEDRNERSRLKKILRELTLPEGMGVILRTAGEGKKARFFVRDLHLLLKQWEEIQERIAKGPKTACVYQEPDLVERTVRDFLTEDIDRVIIDNPEAHRRMVSLVGQISTRSRSKMSLFEENIPIFERFNVERQIEQTFMRKVPLPSGGEIVIEETEAMVSIDVNTGGHKGGSKDGKDFIVRANLEAAQEAARQIRLRNIGGLIVIDFIDMKQKRDRNAVYQRIKEEMDKDSAKSHVLPISQLGLLQMSRQRHKESHSSGIYTSCPYCNGRGIVKSPRSISVEIQRRLVNVARHARRPENGTGEPLFLRVLLHPVNLERLRSEDEQHLLELERSYGVNLSFRADPSYHVENFKVLDGKTGRELR